MVLALPGVAPSVWLPAAASAAPLATSGSSLPWLAMSTNTKLALASVVIAGALAGVWVFADSAPREEQSVSAGAPVEAADAAAPAAVASQDALETPARSDLRGADGAAPAAADPLAAAGGLRLLVTDEHGRALAGPRVHLWLSELGRDDEKADEPVPDWLAVLREQHAGVGAGGILDVRGVEPSSDLLIDLGGRDWVMRTVRVRDLRAGELRDVGRIELEPGFPVSGTVVSEAGQPAPDVMVHLLGTQPSGGSGFDRWGSHGIHLETDAAGRFSMPAVPAGEHVVTLGGEHHVEHRLRPLRVGPGSDTTGLLLTLDAGIETRVTFVDGAGEPVPGTVVEMRRESDPHLPSSEQWRWLSQEREVPADGILRLRGFEPGTVFSLEVEAPGHGRTRARLTAGVDQTVVLESNLQILARVLDGGGAPLPGVRVIAYDGEGRAKADAVADADGLARIANLRGGSFTLGVGAWDRLLARLEGIRPQPASATRVVDFPIPITSSVAVRVESDDADFPGTEVRLRFHDRHGIVRYPMETFERDAEWMVFRGVPGGRWEAVAHQLPEGWTVPEQVFDHEPGIRSEVVLHASRPGGLKLTVRDSRGQTQSGVFAMLRAENGGAAGSARPDDVLGSSDHAGTIHAQDLAPGRYRVGPRTLWWRLWDNEDQERANGTLLEDALSVEIRSGQTTEAELRLLATAHLDLEVTRLGSPIPEAEVSVMRGYMSSSYTTDELGRAELLPLRTGTVEIRARSGDGGRYEVRELELQPGYQTLKIDLAGGEVTGRILFQGAPLPNAKLWLVEDSGDEQALRDLRGVTYSSRGIEPFYGEGVSAMTGSDGRFLLRDLPAGDYRLMVRHAAAGAWMGEGFTLAGDRQRELGDVEVVGGGRLRILTEPSKDLDLWELEILSGGLPALWAEGQIDGEAGLIHLHGLTPGTHTVTWQGATREVEILAGEDSVADFRGEF